MCNLMVLTLSYSSYSIVISARNVNISVVLYIGVSYVFARVNTFTHCD